MPLPTPIHVFLHIGYEKTGTTSIQTFLRKHEKTLQERGILYPSSLGKISHWRVAKCVKWREKKSKPRGAGAEPVSRASLDSYREKVRQELRQEVISSGCQNVIVSSEQISTGLRRRDELENIRDLFGDFDARFTVIVYLRDQVSMAESRAYTAILSGSQKLPSIVAGGPLPRYLSFLATLKIVETFFGRDQMIVRVFDRSRFEGGDVVSDFLSVIGLPELPVGDRIEENSSVGIAGVQLLARANDRIRKLPRRSKLRVRRRLLKLLRSRDSGPRYRLAPDAVAYIREEFGPENVEIARRYLGQDRNPFHGKERRQEVVDASLSTLEQDLPINLLLDALLGEEAASPAAKRRDRREQSRERRASRRRRSEG